MAAYRRVLCVWIVVFTLYSVHAEPDADKKIAVNPKLMAGAMGNKREANMHQAEVVKPRAGGSNVDGGFQKKLALHPVVDNNQPRAAAGKSLINEQSQLNGAAQPSVKKAVYIQRQPQVQAQSNRRPAPIKIAESSPCAKEVKQYCSTSSVTNNFAVLDCLQNDRKANDDLSEDCQHFIWNYKKNLTTDIRFDSAAMEVCRDALKALPECNNMPRGTGQVISCLIEEKDNITSANCQQFLTKMGSIVFSDYRLVYRFADACNKDISQLNCGRLHQEGDESPSSQGKTIECLSEQIGSLDDKCKHEILRIAELQADDYHLDRPLFYACREDRERFCRRTKAGAGKVFKCLYRHKFERDMSQGCREQLVVRQKLIQEDFKASHGLYESCRQDIRRNRCMKGEGIPTWKQAKLSHILLCLEGSRRDEHDVSPECLAEMKDWRKQLLEDYKISPDIVTSCADEIRDSCNGGLQREGKTLHCLMDLARPRPRGQEREMKRAISNKCLRSLEDLIKETDPGEDYRLDPTLQQACQPVVETACKDIAPGDARVLSCLMENLDEEKLMTDDCKEKLLEIQYFISRDFRLSPRLYRKCRGEVKKLCKSRLSRPASENDLPGEEEAQESMNGLVFRCIYDNHKQNKVGDVTFLSFLIPLRP